MYTRRTVRAAETVYRATPNPSNGSQRARPKRYTDTPGQQRAQRAAQLYSAGYNAYLTGHRQPIRGQPTRSLKRLYWQLWIVTKKFLLTLNQRMMNVIQRMQAPTPKFFRVLRTVGLALAAASEALLAAPVALPAGIINTGRIPYGRR